jgi:predicted RNase H-like HicB family nuclease
MNEIKYPAVLYYEGSRIHVRFPDLLDSGFPASTGGDTKEEAIEAAKDILVIVQDVARMDSKELPQPSKLEKVNLDRGYDDVDAHYIEILNISN